MIFKANRIRARGPALKRLLIHLQNGDDNDKIVLLRGNVADLRDARADAHRFGREYCVRQWIAAPRREISFPRMLEAVDHLATEFGFDPSRAVVIGHMKAKASADVFAGHIHILVPETDAVTGRVLSSSNDWLRGEKIAKILSHDWGHPFVESAKAVPILAALRSAGRNDVSDAYLSVFPEQGDRAVAAFDGASQQRLKRQNLDLPALRLMVAEAFSAASDRAQFEAKLSAHDLVCIPGDKSGIFLIATTGGEKTGSLARLAKVKSAAVQSKMEMYDVEERKFQSIHRTGDASEYGGVASHDRAPQEISGGGASGPSGIADRNAGRVERSEYAGSEPGERQAGSDYRTPERTRDREGDQGYVERLRAADFSLAVGLVQHRDGLTATLGLANRNALDQDERVALEFGEIEDAAEHARAMANRPPNEPDTLVAARERLAQAEGSVTKCKGALDDAIATRNVLLKPLPWWRRAISIIMGREHRHRAMTAAAVASVKQLERALKSAEAERISSQSQVRRREKLHRDAVKEHVESWSQASAAAESRKAAATRARRLLELLPGAKALGASGLCNLAAKIPSISRETVAEFDSDWAPKLAAQP